MSDIETFRTETRAWLEANCPESQRVPAKYEDLVYGGAKTPPTGDARLWMERMAERGWTAPEWPAEYGGGGLSPAEAKVLRKEMAALGCRRPLMGHGLWMLGPALLQFGSEEQKKTHLPRIVRGEVRWCQGYSEPGAGSDLASLRCRAELDGDEFVVNGQKSWTTDGDKADWIFCLVRTDPDAKKQEGISFLLIDMSTPGVSVNPVALLNGDRHFCDTFLENVRVPRENLVGEINAGWTIAKGLLGHEREMMSQIQEFMPKLPLTLEEYGERYVGKTADGKLADASFRSRLARHRMNQRAMTLSHQRAFAEGMAGTLDMTSVSYFKAVGTEEDKLGDELLMAMLGSAGLGWEGEGFKDEELLATRKFLQSKVLSLGGGTTEVQWNVVAKKLGLPQAS